MLDDNHSRRYCPPLLYVVTAALYLKVMMILDVDVALTLTSVLTTWFDGVLIIGRRTRNREVVSLSARGGSSPRILGGIASISSFITESIFFVLGKIRTSYRPTLEIYH